MEIVFLGTGTSTGVPTVCCTCAVCESPDPKNKRLRSSILIREGKHNILVDTSTDLRQQCLTHDIKHIDAVLYTHHHADHVHGIDELRCFNFFNKTRTTIYGNEMTLAQLRKNFSYIFDGGTPEGGGIPQLDPVTLNSAPFELDGVKIIPVDILHGSLTIKAYRLNNMAYVTDCSGIPEESKPSFLNLDVLILNALGYDPHPTHFCLSQALEVIEELKPKRAILTHINHKFDHDTVNGELPEGVELAFDGMRVETGN